MPKKILHENLFYFDQWNISLCDGYNYVWIKNSVSQPRDHMFEPHTGHNYDSSYYTSTKQTQEWFK